MSKYTAQAERDGKFWFIRVPEIGYATQARTVDEIEVMARDLIATMKEVPADSFELDVSINLPSSVATKLQTAASLHDEIAEAAKQEREAYQAAAKELAELMPLREVGKLLHVSHQRVHQLVNS
jgi:predicted RNase H-like HicB family nuclease